MKMLYRLKRWVWIFAMTSVALALCVACTGVPQLLWADVPQTPTGSGSCDCTTSEPVDGGPNSAPATQANLDGTARALLPSATAPFTPTARLATPTLTTIPTCTANTCTYPGMLIFARPILAPGNDITDTSYRYGSTQEGQRDPHHGVEFLNAYGTPVYAAAPGVVRVAGDDRTMIYGPYPNFYGNLVIIQHDLKALIDGTHPMRLDGFDLTQPVFTLYAHLSQVLVKPGAQVKAGQLVGQVGMTGNATGPHLHFEVRLGDNAYANSRNPELWLKPHLNEQQQPKGALAGRIVSALEPFPKIEQIVIEHVPDPQGRKDWEIYLSSYVEKTLVYQPPWQENFGVGDLPAGWYRITFAYLGLQQSLVQVLPGQLTVVNFKLGEQ